MGIATNLDITPAQRKQVLALISRYLPNTTVWAFGSRVKFTAKTSSDLDLVAFSTPDQKSNLVELREAFEESDLPFSVDILDWNSTPESFKTNIRELYVVMAEQKEQQEKEGWNTYKLRNITTKIGSGATPRGGKDAYLESGEYSLIRSQNVLDFTFSYTGLAFINKEQANQLNNVTIEERDVLLNITGDSVARVCQVPKEVLPARVNQHVAIIRPDRLKLLPEFLKYYLLNPSCKNQLLSYSAVGATRNALTKGMIEDLDIQIPSIEVQERIASILSTLDDKIELNRQTNQTLEGITQTLFQEMCVPKGEELPEGWRKCIISNLFEVKDGTHDSPKQKLEGKYLITSKHLLKDGTIDFNSAYKISDEDFNEINKRSKVDNFDILYSMIGTIGNTLLVNEDKVDFSIKNMGLFKTSQKQDLAGFIYLFLKSEFAIQYMKERYSGSTQQYVTLKTLREIPINLPNQKTLSEFNKTAVPVFAQIKNNIQETQTLIALRDSILPKLMKGEIEI
jgi:type I restriction enzyme S subunit